MVDMARKLEALGVCAIGTPCVTAHSFHDALQSSVHVPFINMVQETAAYLKNAGCRKAGIMATTGTVHTGLFQKALSAAGVPYALPDDAMQAHVMSLIYDCVKAGKPADMDKFRAVSAALRSAGCDAIILGCTELSIIKRDNDIGARGAGPRGGAHLRQAAQTRLQFPFEITRTRKGGPQYVRLCRLYQQLRHV